MNLLSIEAGFYDAVSGWFFGHGIRVLSIILFVVIANVLIGFLLKKRKIDNSVLGSVPLPSYKNIIGQAQLRRIQTIVNAAKATLTFLVYMVAIVMLLPEFGINVAPVLAGLGLAGLAIGMAAKDVLADFLAGLFIIIEGEYNIGDKVKIAGVIGRVSGISFRRTILRSRDGSIHIIPNREIKLIKRFVESGKEL